MDPLQLVRFVKHGCVCFEKDDVVIYVDPYGLEDRPQDADLVIITHSPVSYTHLLQLEGILRLYHLRPDDVEDAVLSSVVPPMTDTLCRALGTLCGVKPLVLHQSLRTGVTVDIDVYKRQLSGCCSAADNTA